MAYEATLEQSSHSRAPSRSHPWSSHAQPVGNGSESHSKMPRRRHWRFAGIGLGSCRSVPVQMTGIL
ncbi:hypothetical protein HAX54_048325, partial [Datura stramonium]|nr:hypothetical protein [Datura stramonium]